MPNYVGMSLAGLLRRDVFSKGVFRKGKLAVLCAVDLVSQFLCQYGLAVAGSSLYIIIYSSCTIWIALLSRIVIRRRLSAGQWTGCCVVVCGLAVTGGNLASSLSDKSDGEIALGATMILVGSISHAYTWVLVELLLKDPHPIQPEAVSTVMGLAGALTFSLWQLVWTLPRADELVFHVIEAHGGSREAIVGAYLLLTLVSLVHAVTFYHLVGRMGAVTAGVLKGCQAIAVFVGAHVLFCGTQASQCFSPAKACSLVLVLAGTSTYALSRGREQLAPPDLEAAEAAAKEAAGYEGGGEEPFGCCGGCCCGGCCCCASEAEDGYVEEGSPANGSTAVYHQFTATAPSMNEIPSPTMLRRSLSHTLEQAVAVQMGQGGDGQATRAALSQAESAFDQEDAVVRANALLERARRRSGAA